MKKTLLFAMTLLSVHLGVAQTYYYRVKMWEGPKRAYLGGGLVQRVGTPTFAEQGGDALKPDRFSPGMGFMGTLGVDLETRDEGLSSGPYFHFDYFQDSWTADFGSELPVGYNNYYTFRYTMQAQMLGATFGYGLYYHIGERLEVGLGAGLSMMGAVRLDYGSDILVKATGESTGLRDEQTFYSEEVAISKPFNLGVEGKVDCLWFFTERSYVGLQLRLDAVPFYCSLDSGRNMIGSTMTVSDNNRRRMVALVTFGARW